MARILLALTILVASFVGASSPATAAVSCRAYCQYFDDFSSSCDYQQTCTPQGERCLVETRCDRFDSFSRSCDSEASVRRCATGRGDPRLPECRTYCQYFDDFSRECLYQTSCDYTDRCVAARTCERFDDFSRECLSEQTVTTCD